MYYAEVKDRQFFVSTKAPWTMNASLLTLADCCS
jgi:hypothetical protein